MNKIEIGSTAGKIWHLLDNRDKMSISDLQKKLDVSEPLMYLALGWLCHEDKIHCLEENGELLFARNVSNVFFG